VLPEPPLGNAFATSEAEQLSAPTSEVIKQNFVESKGVKLSHRNYESN